MAFGLPPRVSRQRVRQRLAFDEIERSAEVSDGQIGVVLCLPFRGERDRPLHVDGHLGRDLVEPVASARREQELALLVDPQGTTGRIRRVEQRLRRGVRVRRPEHACAQPVAGDDVGVVQSQIGDEFDGAAGTVGGELLAEALQPGRHGQEAHVHGTGDQHPAAREFRAASRYCGAVDLLGLRRAGWRDDFFDPSSYFGRLQMRAYHPAHRVQGGPVAVHQNGEVTGGDRGGGDNGTAPRRLRAKRRRISEEHQVSCDERISLGFGQEIGIVGILHDHDGVGPGPGAQGRPRGPPQ